MSSSDLRSEDAVSAASGPWFAFKAFLRWIERSTSYVFGFEWISAGFSLTAVVLTEVAIGYELVAVLNRQ